MRKVEKTVSLNSVIRDENNPEFRVGGPPVSAHRRRAARRWSWPPRGKPSGWEVIPQRAVSPCVSVQDPGCVQSYTLHSLPLSESWVAVPTKLAPGFDSAPSPQADRPQLQEPRLSPRADSTDQRNPSSHRLDRHMETQPPGGGRWQPPPQAGALAHTYGGT